ncbi:MAG: signal peptide peptidase SppA [Helicobacteraceae bacterium]|jgi:protease-4|nr:signal peptide peptidase SppA [Helicobacteraceae bacterium]
MSEFFKKLFYPITAPIVFIQNHFKAVVLTLILLLVFLAPQTGQRQPNLYSIELYGEIFNAEHFLTQIEAAKADHIRGVLLLVDSPGGAVAPSVEMMMAIRDLSRQKPVVAYASGAMASGSYYASVWAEEIVANPGGIIGSIGVMMEGVNVSKLLDTIGVKINVLKAGEYKEAGAFYRDPTPAEKAQLESVLDDVYNMFVSDVAEARGLNVENANMFANGRIFTPKQALKAQLVDHLGNLDFAKGRLIELSKVSDPIWNEKSELDRFMENIRGETKSFVAGLLAREIKAKLEM